MLISITHEHRGQAEAERLLHYAPSTFTTQMVRALEQPRPSRLRIGARSRTDGPSAAARVDELRRLEPEPR